METRLAQYRKDVEDINGQRGPADHPDDNAKHLVNAVESLPELTERKRVLDLHLNVATALLNEINDRGIDNWYVQEAQWSGRPSSAERAAVLAALKRDAPGTLEDKLRCALAYVLATPGLSADEVKELEASLQEAEYKGAAFNYVNYLRRIEGLHRLAAPSKLMGNSKLSGLADKVETAGRLGLRLLKKIVPVQRLSRVASTVQSVLETGALPAEWVVLDPRQPSAKSALRGPPRDVVVFMVGGGNFVEEGQVREVAQKIGGKRRVLYGSSEILSPTEFLAQLEALGPTVS